MTDQEILNLYLNRDELALIETRKKYGKLLHEIISKHLDNEFEIEECENDVYLKLWNSIPLTKPHYMNAFISRIAKNTAIDRFRKSHSQKRFSEKQVVELKELDDLCSEDDTENEILLTELKDIIKEFLIEQKMIDRRILIYRFWYMYNYNEIARLCGISTGKVQIRLHRLKNKMKKYFIEKGVIEEK